MKQSHWLLRVAKELLLVLENHATVNLNRAALLVEWKLFLWNENLQRKQNLTAKFTNLKENAGKSSQFLASQEPCERKSLEVCLEYCRS